MKKKTKIIIAIDEELKKQLKIYCVQTNMSITKLVEGIIQKYLKGVRYE